MITVRFVLNVYPPVPKQDDDKVHKIRALTAVFTCERCGWKCVTAQTETKFPDAYAAYWSNSSVAENGNAAIREAWEHEAKCKG